MKQAVVFGNTDPGLVRTNNEDAFIAQKVWDNNYWLLAVIDGLGGYEGGEIAAEIARKEIVDYVEGNEGKNCLEVIAQAVCNANNSIYRQRLEKYDSKDMGCVLTAAILDLKDSRMYIAHVGDTRLYQCSENSITKLTYDHSFVGILEDEGKISEIDAMNHPRRNLVDRILGDEIKTVETSDFIDSAIIPIENGAYFLFCSDGLSDLLTSNEIKSVITEKGKVKSKVHKLISLANQKGGKDNITAVVVNINDVPTSLKKVGVKKENYRHGNISYSKKHVKNKKNKEYQSIKIIEENHKGLSLGYFLLILVLLVIIAALIILLLR